jgi:hypothetical protein
MATMDLCLKIPSHLPPCGVFPYKHICEEPMCHPGPHRCVCGQEWDEAILPYSIQDV